MEAEDVGIMLEDLRKHESLVYVRSSLVPFRIIVDTCIVAFALFWNAMGGWDAGWEHAADVLWFPMHLTIIAFDITTHPAKFKCGENVNIYLTASHMNAYRYFTLWLVLIDGFLLFLVSDAIVQEDGAKGTHYERLAMVLVVTVTNVWRFWELIWNVTTVQMEISKTAVTAQKVHKRKSAVASTGARYTALSSTHDGAFNGPLRTEIECIACREGESVARVVLSHPGTPAQLHRAKKYMCKKHRRALM